MVRTVRVLCFWFFPYIDGYCGWNDVLRICIVLALLGLSGTLQHLVGWCNRFSIRCSLTLMHWGEPSRVLLEDCRHRFLIQNPITERMRYNTYQPTLVGWSRAKEAHKTVPTFKGNKSMFHRNIQCKQMYTAWHVVAHQPNQPTRPRIHLCHRIVCVTYYNDVTRRWCGDLLEPMHVVGVSSNQWTGWRVSGSNDQSRFV